MKKLKQSASTAARRCVHGVVVPRRMKKKLSVPIYDAVLWLVVADNIAKERKKLEHLFGPAPDAHDYDAMCSYSGGHTFALFFAREPLTLKILSHEVFHLTHRIMDWVSANFDAGHHEQGALLHGYLMDAVCRAMQWPNASRETRREEEKDNG